MYTDSYATSVSQGWYLGRVIDFAITPTTTVKDAITGPDTNTVTDTNGTVTDTVISPDAVTLTNAIANTVNRTVNKPVDINDTARPITDSTIKPFSRPVNGTVNDIPTPPDTVPVTITITSITALSITLTVPENVTHYDVINGTVKDNDTVIDTDCR